MKESGSFKVTCQDAGDGSGDVIVDLPPELLENMGLGLGDELSVEVVNGVIVLTPKNATPLPR